MNFTKALATTLGCAGLVGVCLPGATYSATAPGPKAKAPAPKAPAPTSKPKAASPKPKAGQASKVINRQKALEISAAGSLLADKYSTCEAFKGARASWVLADELERQVSKHLGRGLTDLDFDKGEFETTLEHRKRISAIGDVYFGNSDRIVIGAGVGGEHQSYDADKQVLTVQLPHQRPTSAGSYDSHYFLVASNNKSLGSKMGQTRMGIKFRYESIVRYERLVGFSESDAKSIFGYKYSFEIPDVKLELERSKAIALQSGLALVMLASFVDAATGDDEDGASLDDPVDLYTRSEVWNVSPRCVYLYDARNKEILHTYYEADAPKPEPAVAARPAPSGPLRAVSSVITNPDWIRKPTSEETTRHYPAAALRLEKPGRAVLRCRVSVSGTLEACTVVSENPADLGFGAAALEMVPLFRMKEFTRDDEPVAGKSVTVPVTFSLQ